MWCWKGWNQDQGSVFLFVLGSVARSWELFKYYSSTSCHCRKMALESRVLIVCTPRWRNACNIKSKACLIKKSNKRKVISDQRREKSAGNVKTEVYQSPDVQTDAVFTRRWSSSPLDFALISGLCTAETLEKSYRISTIIELNQNNSVRQELLQVFLQCVWDCYSYHCNYNCPNRVKSRNQAVFPTKNTYILKRSFNFEKWVISEWYSFFFLPMPSVHKLLQSQNWTNHHIESKFHVISCMKNKICNPIAEACKAALALSIHSIFLSLTWQF